MNAVLILQLLFLLTVANGAPLLAKRLFGDLFARPLDGGALYADGRPVFGASKTWRGVISSVLATGACAPLVGLSALIGVVVGAGAMAGDLFSSFSKRRMARPASSRALGLDQIPEALVPLLCVRLLTPVSVFEIVVVVTLFFFASVLLSRLLFDLKVRDQPF